MQEIKEERLQYYCNAVGELHECGKRMLDSVEELPPMLQKPYLELWTCDMNLYCYIVFLDNQPGILLAAEYDDDYCEEHGIPVEYEELYRTLYKYGERLEALACKINPQVTVGLDVEGGCNLALVMFIPTENVPFKDIPRLYFLMDRYGFRRPPSGIHWTE